MICCLVFFLGIFKTKSDLFLALQYLVLDIKVIALISEIVSYYSRIAGILQVVLQECFHREE